MSDFAVISSVFRLNESYKRKESSNFRFDVRLASNQRTASSARLLNQRNTGVGITRDDRIRAKLDDPIKVHRIARIPSV